MARDHLQFSDGGGDGGDAAERPRLSRPSRVSVGMTPPAAAPVSCLEFFVTLASLILSVYDFSSDFIVAIETSGSVKSQTLYGDVIIYEKSIGKIGGFCFTETLSYTKSQ